MFGFATSRDRHRLRSIGWAVVTVLVTTACGSASVEPTTSAPPGASQVAADTPAPTPQVDADVQEAYDAFVATEMPGVPIELVQAAKDEGKVVAYILAPPSHQAVVDAFQAQFPFIEVQATQLTGGPLVSRFLGEARAGQAIADVVQFASVSDSLTAVDEGLVLEYSVSSEAEINIAQGVSGYLYPVSGDVLAIAYNPNNVSDSDASVLDTWEGLLDPRFDGKQFAFNDVLAGGGTILFNYYLHQEYGTAIWQRMADSGYGIYLGSAPMVDALVAGEADISVGIAASIAAARYTQGAPVHWVSPEPFMANPYLQFISALSPNPNAAKLLQEFTLSPSGQQIFADSGNTVFRNGITTTGAYAGEPWFVPTDPARYWPWDPADIAAGVDELEAAWRSVFQ